MRDHRAYQRPPLSDPWWSLVRGTTVLNRSFSVLKMINMYVYIHYCILYFGFLCIYSSELTYFGFFLHLQGYLLKQGHGTIKRWEKRFVAVKGSKFAYYTSREVRLLPSVGVSSVWPPICGCVQCVTPPICGCVQCVTPPICGCVHCVTPPICGCVWSDTPELHLPVHPVGFSCCQTNSCSGVKADERQARFSR